MIHKIHHIRWSYGWKLSFLPIGYFPEYGLKRIKSEHYHNCTLTGIH